MNGIIMMQTGRSVTPVFIPNQSNKGKLFEDLAKKEALKYSYQVEMQDAFLAGARWEHYRGNQISVLEFTLLLAVIAFAVLQFAGFIDGILNHDQDRLRGKWGYVVPFWYLGNRISKFLYSS